MHLAPYLAISLHLKLSSLHLTRHLQQLCHVSMVTSVHQALDPQMGIPHYLSGTGNMQAKTISSPHQLYQPLHHHPVTSPSPCLHHPSIPPLLLHLFHTSTSPPTQPHHHGTSFTTPTPDHMTDTSVSDPIATFTIQSHPPGSTSNNSMPPSPSPAFTSPCLQPAHQCLLG